MFPSILEVSVAVTEISMTVAGMHKRDRELEALRGLLRRHAVVGIIGARSCWG